MDEIFTQKKFGVAVAVLALIGNSESEFSLSLRLILFLNSLGYIYSINRLIRAVFSRSDGVPPLLYRRDLLPPGPCDAKQGYWHYQGPPPMDR